MESFAAAVAVADVDFAVELDHPAFFKLYRPEHKLYIPPRFIKNFNGKIPKNISLKNESGTIWPAKLAYIEERLYITDGWKHYVEDQKLECGEFVLFRYIQSSTFILMAYSSDGVLKDEPQETRTAVSKTATGNATFDDAVIPNVPQAGNMRFYKTFTNRLKNHVIVPKYILDACGEMRLPQTIKLTNENGKGIRIELRRLSDRVILGYAGLPRFWKKNRVELADKLEFEVMCGSGNRIKQIIMTRSEVL